MKIFAALLMLVTIGCESKPSEPPAPAQPDAALTPDVAAVPDQATAAQVPEVEGPRREPLAPPLQAASVDLQAFKDVEIGTVSGPLFGSGAKLGAIGRIQCGDGVLLQPVFDHPKGMMISPPIPLSLFNLKTWEQVEYEEGNFTIQSHFEVDTPERLKGHLRITYPGQAGRETYIDMTVDGAPFAVQVPAKMPIKGDKPGYPRCVPSGYFSVREGDQTVYGMARVDDAAGRGVPFLTMFITPHDSLAVMLIPRKQGREFKTPVTFDLAYAENPEAKLVAKAVHIGALKPDPEATWKNVDIAREATLLDGKVEATLVKKGKLWKLDMTLKDLKMPSGIDGMEGRTLDEIRVEAYLAKDETLTPELPAMPDWYKRPE